MANDSNFDNNNITQIIWISFMFKIFKLVIIILTLSYFIGIFWFIFCDITKSEEQDGENFFDHFDIEQNSDEKNAIIVTYYAFTTLSTVGFGDFHPRSNPERILCSFILLFGVSIFSFVMGNYMSILS